MATRPRVTFIQQNEPIEEYGRALYGVARSVLRAWLDSLSEDDLADLNTPLDRITLRQLAKVVRIELDKGMRGDGFEWAVHEALTGQEPRVLGPISEALRRASKFKELLPTSLMFGAERARYLGFLDSVIEVGSDAYLLPEGSGRPFRFDTWVATAAQGARAERMLPDRIKQIWKTDLFLSTENDYRYLAATVKSNYSLLEGGRGLRVGIVPESSKGNASGVRYSNEHKLWVVSLADPNGFMGLFNDAYMAVGRAICAVGKQPLPPYYAKPSAKAEKIQEQLERFQLSKVIDIEGALNEAAQQKIVTEKHRLLAVNAPSWLHMKQLAPKIISPKPIFTKLD